MVPVEALFERLFLSFLSGADHLGSCGRTVGCVWGCPEGLSVSQRCCRFEKLSISSPLLSSVDGRRRWGDVAGGQGDGQMSPPSDSALPFS